MTHFGTYGKLKSTVHPYRTDIGDSHADFLTFGKFGRDTVGWAKDKTHWQQWRDWYLMSDIDKKMVLKKQFRIEKDSARERIASWFKHNPGKNLVCEIGNEPNLYPYIAPDVYAWYFSMWHVFIKSINRNIKVMNGGYWIFYGLPDGILESLPALGVKYTAVIDYHNEFLRYTRFQPDIINLHWYPFVDNYGDYCGIKLVEFNFSWNEIWLTEFGNINSLSESKVCQLIINMVTDIKFWENITHIYYFKSSGIDSKLVEFQKQLTKWKNKRLVKRLLKFSHRYKWVLRYIPKFAGIINAADIIELLHLAERYENKLPLQGLETDGKLNSLGRAYFEVINN